MIPFFDYGPEYRRHADSIAEAVRRVFHSGRLILGPEVEAFESEFARATGTAGAVGVGSGTDALVLALSALEARGGEVITVANAGVPPVAAIRQAGATPVFVDVEPHTLTLDPQALAAAIGPRTVCILAVHLYGQPAALDAMLDVAGKTGIPLVEDCAQAHGAVYHGRPVGSLGTFGCFSFYPTKNLGAYGDGGAVVGNDTRLLDSVRLQRMYGFPDGERRSIVEGINSRLDELQAAILRVKLPALSAANDERRAFAARYARTLATSGCVPTATREDTAPVHHLYVVRCEDRSRVAAALECHGVGHSVHYAHAVHLMEPYRGFAPELGALPVTERACASVLSLPLYPGLPEEVFERLERALADLAS